MVLGDICGLTLPTDFISLTCSIRFGGNNPPAMEWVQGDSNYKLNHASSLTQKDILSSSITLSALQLNQSQYTFRVGKTPSAAGAMISDDDVMITQASSPLNLLCALRGKAPKYSRPDHDQG